MKKLLKFIKKKWEDFCFKWSYDQCYTEMENAGIAVFGMCNGVVGGDVTTNYLSYQCIECPHYTPTIKRGGDTCVKKDNGNI